MTLGNAVAARVRFIVWCKAFQHQVGTDAAELPIGNGAQDRGNASRPYPQTTRSGMILVEIAEKIKQADPKIGTPSGYPFSGDVRVAQATG